MIPSSYPVLFFMLSISSVFSKSWVREMTIVLQGNIKDCYYLPDINERMKIYISYQVSEGDDITGQIEVDVEFRDPYDTSIHVEKGDDSSGAIDHVATIPGEYKLCLSDRNGWGGQHVWIDIDVEDPDDDYYDDLISDDEFESMRKMDEKEEDHYEIKISDIKESLHRIKAYTGKAHHLQSGMQASYTKDLKMAIRNGEKITFWSIVHLSVLVVTAMAQVLMVKSLFDDKIFLHKFIR